MNNIPKTILFVDDDLDDREFLSAALRDIDPKITIIEAENGLRALNFLEALKHGNSALPSMIILDLNLPFINGREVFERIRQDERYREVPLIVFSSSENPADINHFNKMGIEFITKPDNITFLKQIAGRILDAV